MDANNPAVSQHTRITPADLAEIGKNPAILSETARKMLALNMMVMHDRMKDVTVPIGQRQQWMDFLSKLGDAIPKQNAGAIGVSGPGFSVQIVMNAPAPAQATPAPAADVVDTQTIEAITNDLVGNDPTPIGEDHDHTHSD